MDANVYQHSQTDEHAFIDSVGDWIKQVQGQYTPYLTESLDPKQSYTLETLVRQSGDLRFVFHGGYGQTEGKGCSIFPDYYEPAEEDFGIALYKIHYPSRFVSLSHRKILGTLVGTGVKRSCFGNIISGGDRWQVFTAGEMDHFVAAQVTRTGKVTICLGPIKYTEIIIPKDSWAQERGIVSFIRLGGVISEVYNISRQRSKQLVEAGRVEVNWTENTRPGLVLELLDIVSVKGYGGVQIQELEGKTKKEKYRVLFGVLRK